MKILGIETSCDETAAAVVEDGRKILSNVVVSQIDIFAEYGGVIPEVAARSHLEAMMPVVDKALADASCGWDDIDAIAVTHAPGLLGSLLIGTLTARTLAILHNKPLYAVHHSRSFSAAPTMFSSAAHDTEITRMHLVRDRPSPLGVTADDVWCRDVPVTPGFPKGQVAPLPLSPSPGALVHSFSPPPRPPPPFPPLPPLAAPHVFRGGLLGACFSWVLLCSRCLVW